MSSVFFGTPMLCHIRSPYQTLGRHKQNVSNSFIYIERFVLFDRWGAADGINDTPKTMISHTHTYPSQKEGEGIIMCDIQIYTSLQHQVLLKKQTDTETDRG